MEMSHTLKARSLAARAILRADRAHAQLASAEVQAELRDSSLFFQ